jgi:hypothetical protein
MGIRESLNQKPALSGSLAFIALALAVGALIWQSRGQRQHGPPPKFAFYSDDDGKTWFPDDVGKLTPFIDSNNRPAVQAFVFKCPDGKPFVAYLQRYTDAGRQALEAARQVNPAAPGGHLYMMMTEVKKPGPANAWVPFDQNNAKAYMEVLAPRCPDGSGKYGTPVFPDRK